MRGGRDGAEVAFMLGICGIDLIMTGGGRVLPFLAEHFAAFTCCSFSFVSRLEGGRGGSLASEKGGGTPRSLPVSIEGLRLEGAGPRDNALIEETLEVIEAKDSLESRRTSCCWEALCGRRGGRAGEGLWAPFVEYNNGD